MGCFELASLTLRDGVAGLALSDAAGWNQTADDWAFFLADGAGVGFRDASGRLVASAAALVYGGGAGWVSMVLVDEAWRHRGLASAAVDACVQILRQAGATPLLDATAAGVPVYRRLGFVEGFDFERWQGEAPLGATDRSAGAVNEGVVLRGNAACRRAHFDDLDALMLLDRSAHGLERRSLLGALLRRGETRAWLRTDGTGFVMSRAGRRARQIGPLVAASVADALDLLGVALADAAISEPSAIASTASASPPSTAISPSLRAERIFVDVPSRWTALAAWLERRGFTRQRAFVRMALGAAEAAQAGDHGFALAGPEFG